MKSMTPKGILLAVLAAALYALNAPLSKLLLNGVPPTLMAGMLYLGAGGGMALVALARRALRVPRTEAPLARADLPFTVAMVVLDIAAPILLMLGLASTPAASAALLNNFEIVCTALIALLVFRETISPRLWVGIGCVVPACFLLSVEGFSGLKEVGLRPTPGALLILAATLCWGIENNCTRRLSEKDPLQIVVVKGLGSGTGALAVGHILGERLHRPVLILAVLALGFVAYGMSIFCYVYAQRMLGAARTGAYYAVAPFISTLLALLIFRDPPPAVYPISLALMAVGVYLASGDGPVLTRRRPTATNGNSMSACRDRKNSKNH